MGRGFLPIALFLCVLIFQSMRIYLSWKLSPLIVSENISSITPPRSDFMTLIPWHRVSVYLSVIALDTVGFELVDLVGARVYLPG